MNAGPCWVAVVWCLASWCQCLPCTAELQFSDTFFSFSLPLCNPGYSEVHTLKFCISLLSGTGVRILRWLQDLHVFHLTDVGPGLCRAEGTEGGAAAPAVNDQADGPASLNLQLCQTCRAPKAWFRQPAESRPSDCLPVTSSCLAAWTRGTLGHC